VTSRESIPVRHAVHDELPAVAAVLSRAFFTDRIYCWMVPDDAQRRRSADVFYARFVDACWAHNEVQIAGTGIGAALWIPPGMPLVSDEDAEAFSRGLFESAGDAASSARMERVMTVVDLSADMKKCPLADMKVPMRGQ
jgi:hypothetical protein